MTLVLKFHILTHFKAHNNRKDMSQGRQKLKIFEGATTNGPWKLWGGQYPLMHWLSETLGGPVAPLAPPVPAALYIYEKNFVLDQPTLNITISTINKSSNTLPKMPGNSYRYGYWCKDLHPQKILEPKREQFCKIFLQFSPPCIVLNDFTWAMSDIYLLLNLNLIKAYLMTKISFLYLHIPEETRKPGQMQ